MALIGAVALLLLIGGVKTGLKRAGASGRTNRAVTITVSVMLGLLMAGVAFWATARSLGAFR